MKVVMFAVGCLFTISLYAQYNVGTTTITFNDPGRSGGFGSSGGSGRQIQTEVYYPAASAGMNVPVASGDFPVIVFGHGFSLVWSAYDNFWTRYVAQGYILAFPRTEGDLSPSHNDFGLDLRLVAERMNVLNTELPSMFYDKLNGKTAIMGHSMGGGSTYLAAAYNSSITTVVTFASAETDPSAIAAAANVTAPALVMYGSKDAVTPPADHSIPLYSALGSARKTLVNIVDGNHCRFANSNGNCETAEFFVSPTGAISRTLHHERTFLVLDPWLAYLLKGDCAAYGTFLNVISATPITISSETTCMPYPDAAITYTGGALYGNLTGYDAVWLLNGNIIPGAIGANYVPTESGTYTWVVTFLDGCQSVSNSIDVNLNSAGIVEEPGNTIHCFPNPVTDVLHISWEGLLPFNDIVVLNTIGQVVISQNFNSSVDFSYLESGVYYVQLGAYTVKVIRE
jgi:dienelactone hydrolase